LTPETQSRLEAQAQRKGLSLPDFVTQLLEQSASVDREKELVDLIRNAVPADLQARYSHLVARRRQETLTPEEHAELLALSDRIEEVDVLRLGWLVELAHLRQMPLPDLLKQLPIKPVPHDG
jgi:hypothetical protein